MQREREKKQTTDQLLSLLNTRRGPQVSVTERGRERLHAERKKEKNAQDFVCRFAEQFSRETDKNPDISRSPGVTGWRRRRRPRWKKRKIYGTKHTEGARERQGERLKKRQGNRRRRILVSAVLSPPLHPRLCIFFFFLRRRDRERRILRRNRWSEEERRPLCSVLLVNLEPPQSLLL